MPALGFDWFKLRWLALAVMAAVLAAIAPVGAQQQGPVIPQPSAGTPAGTPGDESPITPGTPARNDGSRSVLTGVPSWLDRMSGGSSTDRAAPPLLPLSLPETIAIPAGTRIPIVLETPLSSRFSRRGQVVIFRTTSPVRLSDHLHLPPGVEVRGRVAEVTPSGPFGRSGGLRVTVGRLVLPGDSRSTLLAQVRSAEISSRGRLIIENRRPMDKERLIGLSVQGALTGAQFGGKATGIGAGAGAAVAAVLMMSRKGRDVSVAPGTLFAVRLQRDAELPAPAVYWAQQDYAARNAESGGSAEFDDEPRPVLKRRPAAPAPKASQASAP